MLIRLVVNLLHGRTPGTLRRVASTGEDDTV